MRQEEKQAVTLIFSVLVVAVPTYGLTRKGMNQVGKGRLVKYCMSRKYDNGSCDAIATVEFLSYVTYYIPRFLDKQ